MSEPETATPPDPKEDMANWDHPAECCKCGGQITVDDVEIGATLIIDGRYVAAGFHSGCALELSGNLERTFHQWITEEARRATA